MPIPDNTAATPTQAASQAATQDTPQPTDTVQAAQRQERERIVAIQTALEPYAQRTDIGAAVRALLIEATADGTCTVQAAKARLLDLMARDAAPIAGHYVSTGSVSTGSVRTVEAEADKQRQGVQAALFVRAGLAQNQGDNPYRGYSLTELARASLQRGGVRTEGMDKMTLIAAAFTHTSSDFPNLLKNVAQKAMMQGYDEADETFATWTNPGELGDFKVASRVDLGAFPSLRKVAEGAEYKYVTVSDTGETIVLATYGELFSVTRQAIINDDLSGMSKVPRLMGRAAIRTVGDLVYATLTGNPTMSDGVALFHASHNNLAAAGSVISTASVTEARVAMARQKQTGQKSGALNIRLGYILCPIALEGTARVVRDSEYEVGASTKNNTVPNSVRSTFEVVSDARLDDHSATAWYGCASPSMHDTIEVAYLDGNRTPYLEQQQGWTVDGVQFKVRIDAGVAPMSYRTLYRNPGA